MGPNTSIVRNVINASVPFRMSDFSSFICAHLAYVGGPHNSTDITSWTSTYPVDKNNSMLRSKRRVRLLVRTGPIDSTNRSIHPGAPVRRRDFHSGAAEAFRKLRRLLSVVALWARRVHGRRQLEKSDRYSKSQTEN